MIFRHFVCRTNGKSSPELSYLRRVDLEDEISLTAIQAFGVFIPGGSWNFGNTPIITYNHESEEWTVPLHLTAGKTFIINGRPWKFSLDLNYYVERPDAIAPKWMISHNWPLRWSTEMTARSLFMFPVHLIPGQAMWFTSRRIASSPWI